MTYYIIYYIDYADIYDIDGESDCIQIVGCHDCKNDAIKQLEYRKSLTEKPRRWYKIKEIEV